jgi:hypothetical protein
VWDSTFSTEQEKDGVQLRLVMTASPKHFLAKMALGMMTKMVSKALEKDLEAVKRFCES